MEYKFEYLCIPLDGTTKLDLPYVIYDSPNYEVVLQSFDDQDLERAFRLRFEDEQSGSYRPVYLGLRDHFVSDDNMSFALHDRQIQLRAIPKDGTIDDSIGEKLSIGLECALGFFDEYVSWVYDGFSTVASRGAYRSHQSTRRIGTIGEEEVRIIRSVLTYEDSGELP